MSKSPSLRRIQADIRELSLDPSPNYHAAPLENDMFEWHFTIKGAEGTDFEGGVYHGRILLPPEYPFKPPHIMFLTPSGRFETNTKICLSFTAFHAELWQPAWGIRLILEALISFMPSPADGAIGSLDWSSTERKRLAKKSVEFCCDKCGKIVDLLPKIDPEKAAARAKKTSPFAKQIAELQRLQQVNEAGNTKTDDDNNNNENSNHESNVEKTSGDQESVNVDSSISAIIQKQQDEEEVVFVTDDDDDDDENNMEKKDGKEDCVDSEKTMSATDSQLVQEEQGETNGSSATDDKEEQENTTTRVEVNVTDGPAVAMENGLNANDISSIYDPLLNLMIILMALICYLLTQKYMALQAELEDFYSDEL